MIKIFVLTMVFATSDGAGGISNQEYPLYEDCKAASSAFVSHAKRLTGVTFVNSWCTVKNVPKEQK